MDYVRLSKEISYALRHAPWEYELEMGENGIRRDGKPVLRKINAKEAWNEGAKFYHGNETIWLADYADKKYIRV